MATTFAIRPLPHQHEQFAGYLLRLAHHNGLGLKDVVLHLLPHWETARRTRTEFLTLYDSDIQEVAATLDVPRPLVESLLYWTEANRPKLRDQRRITASATVTLERYVGLIKRSSRACPHCLAESDGHWPKLWRLRWYLCCPKHGTLLLSRCPACKGSWLSLRCAPEDVHPRSVLNITHRPPPPDSCHGWQPDVGDWCRTPFSDMMAEPAPEELVEATTHFAARMSPEVAPAKPDVERLVKCTGQVLSGGFSGSAM